MEVARRYNSAFTLIEMLLSLVVLMILISIAISSYSRLIAQQELQNKAELLYRFLHLAQSQSIKQNKKLYVHFCQFETSLEWKVALAESATCDCFTKNSCLLNGKEKIETLTDGELLFSSRSDISFSGQQVSYSPMRFSINAGSVILNDHFNRKLKIIQSTMRLRICSPVQASLGYKKC